MASQLVWADASGTFSLIIPIHFCCCLDSKILSCCGLRGVVQSSASQTPRCMCILWDLVRMSTLTVWVGPKIWAIIRGRWKAESFKCRVRSCFHLKLCYFVHLMYFFFCMNFDFLKYYLSWWPSFGVPPWILQWRAPASLATPSPWPCLRFSISNKLPNESSAAGLSAIFWITKDSVQMGQPLQCQVTLHRSSLFHSTTTSTWHDKGISGYWQVAHWQGCRYSPGV